MYRHDTELSDLIETGKKQGHLTFTQVNRYLPDEALTPEKLDHLLMCLEELDLEVYPDADSLFADIARVYREQITALGKLGCTYLQLDRAARG